MSTIPKLKYPNIPNMLGVPKLARALNANPVTAMVLGKVEGEVWRKLTTENRWGVFKNGKPYLLADSVIEVSVNSASKASTYPQASIDGKTSAFATYNKVNDPNEYRIRMTKGCSLTLWGGRAEDDRKAFIDSLENLKQSIELVDVVTPEKVYTSCTLENYDYRREQSSGAYMIVADITLKEVRQVDVKYTKEQIIAEPQSPNGEDPSSNGQVQGQEATAGQNQSVLKQISENKLSLSNLQTHADQTYGTL